MFNTISEDTSPYLFLFLKSFRMAVVRKGSAFCLMLHVLVYIRVIGPVNSKTIGIWRRRKRGTNLWNVWSSRKLLSCWWDSLWIFSGILGLGCFKMQCFTSMMRWKIKFPSLNTVCHVFAGILVYFVFGNYEWKCTNKTTEQWLRFWLETHPFVWNEALSLKKMSFNKLGILPVANSKALIDAPHLPVPTYAQ